MDERKLRAFIAAADRGSLAKAGQELNVSAVSVMARIDALEDLVGARLLERTPRGVVMTAEGRSFYEDAQRMLALGAEAIRRARALAASGERVIRAGTSILRPCKALMDLWERIGRTGDLDFQIQIVPFDDGPDTLGSLLSSGGPIDLFVGPCDSVEWRRKYGVLPLGTIPCRVAVPRGHRLAGKGRLTWGDLEGETLLLVRRGESPVLDQIRDEILEDRPGVRLTDAPHFYDTSVFNECERRGCLMESLDIWRDVHPGLATIPMEWGYEMPWGIVYAKEPREAVRAFIERIAEVAGAP